jgi:beta-galactosidase
VSTRLGPDGLRPVRDTVLVAADVHSGLPAAARGRVEHTVRQAGDDEFSFVVNLTDEPVDIGGIGGIDGAMLAPPDGPAILAPRGLAVIRRAADQSGDGKPGADPARPVSRQAGGSETNVHQAAP